jgi:ATP-binding protein involved in chromosome partitioning
VGKSSVAVNLAAALAAEGWRTGLLDCDIYGPSIPRMTGLTARPDLTAEDKLIPLTAHGLSIMSIGFMVEEETPMIWRGPMVQSAVTQMLRDVAWGTLDILIIDMPPGTGDAQLTLAQQVPLSGAVIVSTPQEVALADARKATAMFRRVAVPVLGLVENMSYFVCPHCGERTDIFAHGGAAQEAMRLGVGLLGEVPIMPEVRSSGDSGTPLVQAAPDSLLAETYRGMARSLMAGLDAQAARPAPTIRFV